MKLSVNACLDGKEIADQFVNEIKNTHGIAVNDGSYTVKCIVHSEKQDKDVEVDLNNVKFVFERN